MASDDPAVVRQQYETERNLQARQALWAEVEGENAGTVLWQVLAARRPRKVLEVGGGQGELAERMQRELGAEVMFVDISPRMVELARARGIDARQGDAQSLPFADGSFDTVVAAWMLYHVPDVSQALAEFARVLQPGGALIAVTNGDGHLGELRKLLQFSWEGHTFGRESGEEQLRRHFREVERLDADVEATVYERDVLVCYGASVWGETQPIPADIPLPFVVHGRTSIFFATT